jgi:hypothetical protein
VLKNWPHLRVRSLSQGGPGGLYRYPENRVSLYTSFKSRQGPVRASMRYHVSCSFGPHLPAEVGSGATTCPAAPDHASLLRWASALPRVPQLWTLPPWWGELRCCHVSYDSRLCLPERRDLVLPLVPRLEALPSWEGSSGAATCPTPPADCGPQE